MFRTPVARAAERGRALACGACVEPVGGVIVGESAARERAEKRGVVAVAVRAGRFLAIRRGATVAAPGRLCFPGGHIEPGEAEHEAVVRECREELAAVVEPRDCVWRSVTAWGTSLAWWSVEMVGDGELVPHPVEVAEILWLTAEEMIREPTLLEGNRDFLDLVARGVVRL